MRGGQAIRRGSDSMMRPGFRAAPRTGEAATNTPRCPICGKAAPADQFGFVECDCGWGGPGDPVESARGVARWLTLLDRRVATMIARRELARIARAKSASGGGVFYIAALSVMSSIIYLIVGALLAGSVILFAQTVMAQLWIGAVLDGAVVAYVIWALFGFPQRVADIVAPLSRHPQLEALVSEVAETIGAQTPQWVILFPGANFYVVRRMLWGHASTPQIALGVGVAGLAHMNDHELRAVLAHELAHYQYAHTFFARFFGGAEAALYKIIDGIQAGISTNYKRDYMARRRTSSSLAAAIGVLIIWVLSLPLRMLWFAFHLLRMRQSRSEEYEADAAAIEAYGPQAFIYGLTAVQVAAATLRGAGLGIRQEMVKHNNPNFFAELRRHYAELPPSYLSEMRIRAAQGYRTVESSHPISPDRIRAAMLLQAPEPPAEEPWPVYDIITPVDAPDTEALERRLTDILLDRIYSSGSGRRRRR